MAGKILNGGRALYVWTATNGTTPTVGATAVYSNTDQIDTDVSFDDQGVATVTVNHTQFDEAWVTFLETYARPSAGSSGTVEDITYEDNTTVLGAAASGTLLYVVVKGGTVSSGSSDGKRMGFHMFGVAQKSSGSWNQSGGVYNKPTLSFVAQAVEGTITIASTYFSSVLVTAATQTLNSTSRKYGTMFFG